MFCALRRVAQISNAVQHFSQTQCRRQQLSCVLNVFRYQTFTARKTLSLQYGTIHNIQIASIRTFHTTHIRKAIPALGPILVKLMSPISRLFVVLVGRRFRKWWSLLPPERREFFMNKLYKYQYRLYITSGIGGLTAGSFYVYRMEETPITGRKRFMMLNGEQVLKLAELETKYLTEKLSGTTLPTSDHNHTRVYNIVSRIFTANNLRKLSYAELFTNIHIIVGDEVNAFVVPDGNIFVYTGMLKAVDNDDELAGVLGHELSHVLLSHSAEQLSRASYINVFSIVVCTLLWAVAPTDYVSFFASLLQNQLENILLTLPYSRKLEREADEVGMMLAAKACYDVTKIPKFWERMVTAEIKDGDCSKDVGDWLSTHPSHRKRVQWLEDNMQRALDERDQVKCPKLDSFFHVVKRSMFDWLYVKSVIPGPNVAE